MHITNSALLGILYAYFLMQIDFCLSFYEPVSAILRTRNVATVLVKMKSLQDQSHLSTTYTALVPCNQGRRLNSCNVCYFTITTKIASRMFTKREATKRDRKLEEKRIRAPKICFGSRHRLRILVRVFSLG
jgi:hypothetical protein